MFIQRGRQNTKPLDIKRTCGLLETELVAKSAADSFSRKTCCPPDTDLLDLDGVVEEVVMQDIVSLVSQKAIVLVLTEEPQNLPIFLVELPLFTGRHHGPVRVAKAIVTVVWSHPFSHQIIPPHRTSSDYTHAPSGFYIERRVFVRQSGMFKKRTVDPLKQ